MLARMRMTAAAWGELVEAWQTSGQSARDFAAKKGIAESSLRWWKTELARRARREPARRSPGPHGKGIAIARVVREGEEIPMPIEPLASTVEPANPPVIVAVGAVRILVQHEFDAQLLREVVRALSER